MDMSPNEIPMEQKVTIVYTNWKGATVIRNILPIRIYFGSNEWHKENQWLLQALDLDKTASRTFAIKDIRVWFMQGGKP